VSNRRRSSFAALALGLTLVAGACSSDKKVSSGDTTATTAAAPSTTGASTETSAAPPETTAPAPETTGVAGETTVPTTGGETGGTAMTITFNINPDAVWDDGSPITAADFKCSWEAQVNTPGSITTAGYDQITSVEAGDSDKQVIASFKSVYAPYKGLFTGLIKASAVEDCNDISGDFQTELPFSGREWKLDSWSEEQEILVPNEAYWGTRKPTVPKVVMVPKADSDTEIASLKAGEVDFIYPQFYAGIADALADPNVKVALNYGGDYEAIYFQMTKGPFADPAYRKAFVESIDLDALFQQIYVPIAADRTPLTCGPIVPGDYCPDGIFGTKLDLAAAEKDMTDAGYEKNGEGLWAKDGEVPQVRWMINAGNTRRENTQAYLIPLLKAAGFDVIDDNCEAECVFQQRLPAGDYDMAMYISTAPPDPSYLVPGFTCDNIPTEENGNQGQNSQGWCNQKASDELHESDVTADATKRADLIKDAITAMDTDNIMIPLFQFPKSGAYRTDQVGNVEGELNNYRAFNDFYQWEDVNGDGQIVIGAEQWPGCLNPVTECSNSSWYVWTIGNVLLPGVWDTTNDAKYELTDLVSGEPEVVVN